MKPPWIPALMPTCLIWFIMLISHSQCRVWIFQARCCHCCRHCHGPSVWLRLCARSLHLFDVAIKAYISSILFRVEEVMICEVENIVNVASVQTADLGIQYSQPAWWALIGGRLDNLLLLTYGTYLGQVSLLPSTFALFLLLTDTHYHPTILAAPLFPSSIPPSSFFTALCIATPTSFLVASETPFTQGMYPPSTYTFAAIQQTNHSLLLLQRQRRGNMC